MELLLPFRFWTFYPYWHVIQHPRNKFYPNWTITDRVMTLCRFSKMAAILLQICFRFVVLWRLTFRKAKNYLHTKLRPDISIHGQDITASVAENKHPSYLNSIQDFDFDLFTAIGMWFCAGLPNFVRNRRSATELWRHIDFTRWRP